MVIMLRVGRESPGRFHNSPQAYRVMKSWNGAVKSVVFADSAVDVLVSEYFAASLHTRGSALLIGHLLAPLWRPSRVGRTRTLSRIRVTAGGELSRFVGARSMKS